MKNNIHLSLIIPAYNEGKIIQETLNRVFKFLSKKHFSWEVIVIDDGSADNTADLITDFADKNKRIRLVKLKKNRGKGAALRAGVEKAKGEYVIYSDADLSVPLRYLDELIKELKENDVVIGSRRVKGAKILAHQSWMRENMGRFYTFLSRVVTGVCVSDFTCGFKGFRGKTVKDIFKRALLGRWAYDSEILFLAKKLGYKIREVPVEWRNREDTRVVLGNAIITSFVDLFRIRINDLLGKYNS